jgi:SAM-dependent methyltransferase
MNPDRKKTLYDDIGGQYLRNRSLALNDYVELPTVMSLLPPIDGKPVLDAGCGLGKHSRELIRRGGRLTAIDISAKMITIAKDYCENKGEFVRTSFENARFKPASFNVILASMSVMYSRKISTVFQNFGNWLKPKGTLIFSIYHPIRYHQKIPDFDYSKSKKVWITLSGFDVNVFNYYHPLTKYFDALRENNFDISNFIEPVLSRKQKDWPDSDAYRVPRLIVFKSEKRF